MQLRALMVMYKFCRLQSAMMRKDEVSWLLKAQDMSFAVLYCAMANISKLC